MTTPLRMPVVAALVLLVGAAGCSPRATVAPTDTRATVVLAGARDLGPPVAEALAGTDTTIAGEAIRYPDGAPALVTAQIVTIAPGQVTGWHRHGVPTFGYILSGRLEVEYDGAGRRTLVAGDHLMEAMKVAHNGSNLGTEPVRILVVYLGAQGKPLVVKADSLRMPAGLGAGRDADLVDLPAIDPRVRVDLRYAGRDNFTGDVVYASSRALMQRPAAEALRRANDRAHAKGFGLLILDAYRPWSVTRMFWDNYPMHRAYLADPLQGSRHNRGCAVDLTLYDLATGREVKMPSGYDDFSERAHPHFAGGEASERASRDLLRGFMEAEGFTVYENEWWHFDYTGWRDWPVLDVPFDAVQPLPPLTRSPH